MRYQTSRIRTRVVAYRPRSLFGDQSTRTYTRLFTETRYGAGVMRLPWGYDLWPLY
jgi:hypothetical protein